MAFTYTFNKPPFKLGEYDETYGQSWWAEVKERLEPVKFNIKSQQDVTIKDRISCEEQTMKQTAKGKEYWQLRKVSLESADSAASPASTPAQQPALSTTSDELLNLMREINAKLDKLIGTDDVPEEEY